MNSPLHKLVPLAAGLLSAFGAIASEPAAAPADARTEAVTAEKTNCLQHTGSRIQTNEERPCIAGPGQVITREQIERTGSATVADAIRRSSASVH